MEQTLYKIRKIESIEEMLAYHDLLLQTYPKLNKDRYAAYLQDMLPNSYRQVGVFKDEHCVAISGYWILTRLYCGRYIDVDNFVVEEQYRSAGLGGVLLKWMEEEAKNLDCRFSILDAYTENRDAHRFYHCKGYTIRGFHFLKRL